MQIKLTPKSTPRKNLKTRQGTASASIDRRYNIFIMQFNTTGISLVRFASF
jgi:hypothetical protein